MLPTIDQLIQLLQFQPHPEGGFYCETFRSPLTVRDGSGQRERAASTAIYFLLPAGTFSAFHIVKGADELWHYYAGDPLEIHTLSPERGHEVHALGLDLNAGQRPQIVIPAGVYQAAITNGERYSLCGCTVAPGFEFRDFAMPGRWELIEMFPSHTAIITQMTRE